MGSDRLGERGDGVRVIVFVLIFFEFLEFCFCMFLFGKSKIKIFFNDVYGMVVLIYRFGFRS